MTDPMPPVPMIAVVMAPRSHGRRAVRARVNPWPLAVDREVRRVREWFNADEAGSMLAIRSRIGMSVGS